MAKGPRGLTPEEIALWKKVTERTQALHPDRPQPVAKTALREVFEPSQVEPAPLAPFKIGQTARHLTKDHHFSPALSEQLAGQPVQMDRKRFNQMKRGKHTPEARLDLHGLTVSQAHPALTRFIFEEHAKGRRLVLVITGKGKDKADDGPIPIRKGVLRHQVPQWLAAPPLSQFVLQVSHAHLKHGGGGALYVYLRRSR